MSFDKILDKTLRMGFNAIAESYNLVVNQEFGLRQGIKAKAKVAEELKGEIGADANGEDLIKLIASAKDTYGLRNRELSSKLKGKGNTPLTFKDNLTLSHISYCEMGLSDLEARLKFSHGKELKEINARDYLADYAKMMKADYKNFCYGA